MIFGPDPTVILLPYIAIACVVAPVIGAIYIFIYNKLDERRERKRK